MGIDQDLPPGQVRGSLKSEGPDETMTVAQADGPGKGISDLMLRRGDRHDLQGRLLPEPVLRALPPDIRKASAEGLEGRQPGPGYDDDPAPGLRPEEHQVPVVDRRHDAGVPHGDALHLLGDADLPQVVGDLDGPDGPQLAGVDAQDVLIVPDELHDEVRHDLLIDGRYRTAQGLAQVLQGHGVPDARARNHGDVTDDVAGRPGSGVDVHVKVPAVPLEELLPGQPIRESVDQVRKPLVAHADVQLGPKEFLLMQAGRDPRRLKLGLEGPGRTGDHRQKDHEGEDR
ncbi:hypothetical protein HRbin11_02467 [bacterium HR11]|nr:hypothetical protein HRbin11_02467 [bacterium HR11]